MGLWKNKRKENAQNKHDWSKKPKREFCEAYIVDRPSPKSHLQDARLRRVDTCGRYLYR